MQEADFLRQQLEQQAAAAWELQEAMAVAEAAAEQMQADLLAAQEQAARFQRQAQNMEGYGHQLQEVGGRVVWAGVVWAGVVRLCVFGFGAPAWE